MSREKLVLFLAVIKDRLSSVGFGRIFKSILPFIVEAAGGSKKLAAFAGASIVIISVHLGLPLTEMGKAKVAEQVMMLTMTYLGAQGLADIGKEKEKVKIEKSKKQEEK